MEPPAALTAATVAAMSFTLKMMCGRESLILSESRFMITTGSLLLALAASRVTPAPKTMNASARASLAKQRFQMQILGGFAVLALLLAVVGLYGVLSIW